MDGRQETGMKARLTMQLYGHLCSSLVGNNVNIAITINITIKEKRERVSSEHQKCILPRR